MFTYENGKKLAIVGFGIELLLQVIVVFMALTGEIYGLYKGLGIIGIFEIIAILAITGGFGIMWADRRETVDIALSGLKLLQLLCAVIIALISVAELFNVVSLIASILFYLIFALSVKEKSNIACLLLCGAALYTFITIFITVDSMVGFVITGLLSVGCAAACFLAATQK